MKEDNKLVEVDKNSTVLDLIDKERNILAKSQILKLSNLANKMTATQNAIFSLALRNVKIDGNSAITEIPISELLELLPDSSHRYFDKRIIARDVKAIEENHIDLIDEKFFNNDPNGKLKVTNIFSYFYYERGKFIGIFNSTPDRKGKMPLIEVLKSQEINPLVYNLQTFSKLSISGQVLYEELLILSNQGFRSVKYSLDGLKQLFRINGASMNRFYTINQKHLKDAVSEINENTEMNLIVKQIKDGRAVIGVELVWSLEKVSLPATEKQLSLMNDLYVQMKKHDLVERNDIKLLEQLENNHLLNSKQAQGVIATALGRVSELEQELKVSPVTTLDKIAENYDLSEVEKLFPKMTRKVRKFIVKALLDFPEEEREGILELALDICNHNKAKNPKYLITILNNWAIDGVQSRVEALGIHDQNYGELLEDVSDVEISDDFRSAMDLWKD